MSLHLLGKKSWNVYNPENIVRVRRDEAAAKAAEEAEEQRMQDIDAQRRLAILRGEAPPPLEDERHAEPAATREPAGSARHDRPGGTRRARRRHGEDDTDFELRLAQERSEAPTSTLAVARKPTSSAPIVDSAGHFDLFGDERSRAHAEKNEEAERELQKKKREYEDQYRMRLSNAAGRDGLRRPWYSQSDLGAAEAPSKDVWGNEDPRRREREAQRRAADDPLAMMKAASAQIRELNRERKRLEAEREEELRQLKREDGRREKAREREERERRHRSRSPREASDRRQRRSRDGRDGGHGGHRDERRRRDDGRWRRQSHSPDRGPRRHWRDYD